ncbi:MAG: hypothetical protein LBQ98_00560 [Nitrososphaerota archaeon]|jgi:hypothetical protein|nr:hypothetical protein [Nitrososphaerota archaeon]
MEVVVCQIFQIGWAPDTVTIVVESETLELVGLIVTPVARGDSGVLTSPVTPYMSDDLISENGTVQNYDNFCLLGGEISSNGPGVDNVTTQQGHIALFFTRKPLTAIFLQKYGCDIKKIRGLSLF